MREPEDTDHLSTEEVNSPSDNYSTNIRNWLIEDVAARTAMKMDRKKASGESLLRAVQRGRTQIIRER
ncbi:hypothetical protein ACTXT7_006773 [Hymenolepis weldensis]